MKSGVNPLSGRKQSPEHIAKRVELLWQNGTYKRNAERLAERNRALRGTVMAEETKKKISQKLAGKRNAAGCKRTLEWRKRMSDFWKDNPKHNHWIDGRGWERSSVRLKEMGRIEYRLWRSAVFERDNYTCVSCLKRGGRLHADHIKPYCAFPELRFDLENGRTLCVSCHMKSDTHGEKARRFLAQRTSV